MTLEELVQGVHQGRRALGAGDPRCSARIVACRGHQNDDIRGGAPGKWWLLSIYRVMEPRPCPRSRPASFWASQRLRPGILIVLAALRAGGGGVEVRPSI